MTESLDKIIFYQLVTPGPIADRASDDASRVIARTRSIREQPAVLGRIQDVWSMTVAVWGNEESAVDFLFRRHAMLDDHRPVDVLMDSDEGALLVKDILGRLRYGSAA